MNPFLYFDRAGCPIEPAAYARLLEDPNYKRVALTRVGKLEVSTVWIGLDHNLGRGGPPLIFETMVFPDEEGPDLNQWWWPTEAAALAGHDQVTAAVRAPVDGA